MKMQDLRHTAPAPGNNGSPRAPHVRDETTNLRGAKAAPRAEQRQAGAAGQEPPKGTSPDPGRRGDIQPPTRGARQDNEGYVETSGRTAKGLDTHPSPQRRPGAAGGRETEEVGLVDAAEKREQVPTRRERERGEGSPGARPTPHLPPRSPASPSGRGQHVRSGRTCVRGAAGGNRRRAPRLPEPERPRAPPGAVRRLTRGLSRRRRRPPRPGPACAAKAERPRPGVAVSRGGSARRPGPGVRATGSLTSACFRTTLSGLSRFPRSR